MGLPCCWSLTYNSILYLVLQFPWLQPLMAGGTETKPVCSSFSSIFVHICIYIHMCTILGETILGQPELIAYLRN